MVESKFIKLETIYDGVFVMGLITESKYLYVQIYDYVLGDSLYSDSIKIPMSFEKAKMCLEEIQAIITDTVIKDLWLKWVVRQYGFEKKQGNVNNFNEFIRTFRQYIEVKNSIPTLI